MGNLKNKLCLFYTNDPKSAVMLAFCSKKKQLTLGNQKIACCDKRYLYNAKHRDEGI